MKFGEFIRLNRIKRNLKLTKTAEMLDISTSYLSSLENSNRPAPSFDALAKIADVLNLNTNERYQLYDLAAESKKPPTLADDLIEYIYQVPQIRELLRYSMECRLTERDWDRIFYYIKNNYFY